MTKEKGKHMIRKERALVTGAAGFIASHLVELLLARGYEVVALEKPGADVHWLAGLDVKLVYGDLTEQGGCDDALGGVSYIYHLAARLGGGDKPSELYKVNSEGTKNLLDACVKNGVKLKRFLFASSFAAVGATGESVFDEESPANPQTDYGKSKLMAENYVRDMAGKIPYTIVRLPLGYGPRSRWGMFTFFKMVDKGLQLRVGKSETNVGFVKDTVRGMVLAAESARAVGQTYFLGEDRFYNSRDVLKAIAEALGKKTVTIWLPYPVLFSLAWLLEKICVLFGVKPIVWSHSLSAYLNSNWRFSMRKAREELGFEVEYPLKKGLKVTAAWYRDNGYL